MSGFLKSLTAGFAVAALGMALAPAALAQAERAPRLIKAWEEPVKLADGREAVYRYEVTHDYDSGITLRRAYDASGALVESKNVVQPSSPSPEEIAEAIAIVRQDAELSALAAERNATIDGGFVLFGEQLDACAAPSRCLQLDIMGPDRIESVRFVVVDLRSGTVVERDLFPNL